MSPHIGLANRRLQPLGHLSEGRNTYAFGTSSSNDGSESAESAESKHRRGGPKSGPTPVSFEALERERQRQLAARVAALRAGYVGAKFPAREVPEEVTVVCPLLKRLQEGRR